MFGNNLWDYDLFWINYFRDYYIYNSKVKLNFFI